MRKILLIASICFLSLFGYSEQKVLTLQPGAEGKDAGIEWIESGVWQESNYGNAGYLRSAFWTYNGWLMKTRFLIEFNMDALPRNADIVSAKLTLFHDGSKETQSNQSGSNEVLVKRVTIPWEENKVTWNNQPRTTDEDMVVIPATTSDFQNVENIDITKLVKDVLYEYPNYGFLFMLKTEEKYRRMQFASSDNANGALHPQLVITYNESDTCRYSVYDTIHVTEYDTLQVTKYDTLQVTVYDTIRTVVHDTVKVDVVNVIPQYTTVHDTLVIDAHFTGKELVKFDGTIKIYPNPTKSDLNISVKNADKMAGYSIKIVDETGKTIFTTPIGKEFYSVKFDQFVSRGLYFVQIMDSKQDIIERRKIVLE